ncbi:radical SAM protein [Halorubrum saccharovorum]|uniref:radical SAM protein n=1 Tax=Halorubrum saccharovorum TaxID=2248 RepID=UPI001364A0C2|nr:radical SAM protein [Halorubrum saccharovorum]
MEDDCGILFYGDELTENVAPKFESRLSQKYSPEGFDISTEVIPGGTSTDANNHFDSLNLSTFDVIVIGFGFYDYKKKISPSQLQQNFSEIVSECKDSDLRVILNTIHPTDSSVLLQPSVMDTKYNEIIRDIAEEHRIQVGDVYRWWEERVFLSSRYLTEEGKPNSAGQDLTAEALLNVVPQSHKVILWQFNGRANANCNYDCPYCYYPTANENFSFGSPSEWKKVFKNAFGDQNLIFYFTFAEPTIARDFFDYVEMIGSVPNWELRITTNLSLPEKSLEKLANTKLAKDGRLHINASFHPSQTSIDSFLNGHQVLRENGIEAPVIYVMYPPQIDVFEEHFNKFDERDILVHVRPYQGEGYPAAYTDEQRRQIAQYMDKATIRYVLNRKPPFDRHTYAGLHFYIADAAGNIGYDSNSFQWQTRFRTKYGNLIQYNSLEFPTVPPKYPKGDYPKTVDGVSNLLEVNYKQLEGNNVLSYAEQGGVYRTEDGVIYENKERDFQDSSVRAQYYFPSRNVWDAIQKYQLFGAINSIKYIWSKYLDNNLHLYFKHTQQTYETDGVRGVLKKAYRHLRGGVPGSEELEREVIKDPLHKSDD